MTFGLRCTTGFGSTAVNFPLEFVSQFLRVGALPREDLSHGAANGAVCFPVFIGTKTTIRDIILLFACVEVFFQIFVLDSEVTVLLVFNLPRHLTGAVDECR